MANDDEIARKQWARRRLIGAVSLALLIVVLLPMVFENKPRPLSEDVELVNAAFRALQAGGERLRWEPFFFDWFCGDERRALGGVRGDLYADEGLWPYAQFPKQAIQEKYQAEISDGFLDNLRQASVLIGDGAGSLANGSQPTTRPSSTRAAPASCVPSWIPRTRILRESRSPRPA